MKKFKKECDELGSFEYRMPNIPEAMSLLGEIGINSSKLIDSKNLADNDLVYFAKIIEQLGRFVSNIKITIDGKKITKYEDLLEEFIMIKYLNEVAVDLIGKLNISNKKK